MKTIIQVVISGTARPVRQVGGEINVNICADVVFSISCHSSVVTDTARRHTTAMTITCACAMVVSGNVGYGNKASQSDGFLHWSKRYPARLALDGNTDPDFGHNSCSHPTAPSGTNAWWMVDLGSKYRLYSVIIYNRKSAPIREYGISLEIGPISF